MSEENFWSNRERAQGDVEEVSRLRSLLNPLRELERAAADFEALRQLAAEEPDSAHPAEAEKELLRVQPPLLHRQEEVELRHFLSGENDLRNAFLAIHAGL